MTSRTCVEIDLDAIEYNYNNTRAKLPNGCKLLGVIKANAYGHGAVEISQLLEDKCDFFGVASIEEALELKYAGVKTPLLILGTVFEEAYADVVKYDIRIPIFSYDMALALSNEAVRQGKTVDFHFCLDTGMSRIGFQATQENADICKKITELPNINAEGLFSHFATADELDLSRAVAQQERFKAFVKMLEDRGVNIPIKHLNNSAGIMNFDEKFDMCRMGIILYGLYPSDDVDKSLLDIKPAMSWKSRISHIKSLEKGREISYGGTYTTQADRIIATIPVGYADGYPRCLSNIGKVIINDTYAPIVGRVCMDQFMVDITDIKGVNVGDEVILMGKGKNTEISIEELSGNAHSFNYELACRIDMRVPRVFIKDGKEIKQTNYILK